MEINLIIHIVIMIGLAIATITDIKKREVPDSLNFGLIILGIIIGIILSVIRSNWQPIIASVIGLAIGYVVGAIMFYTGQWGGGDAKMLMGMGSVIGVQWTEISKIVTGNFSVPYFITTIITIFIAGGVYGVFYTIGLIIKNWKEFKEEFRKKRQEKQALKLRKIVIGICLAIIILMLIVNDQRIRLVFGIMGLFIFLGQYLAIVSKVVEQVCMIKTIPIRKLTEGDWIVEKIIVKGKEICGPKDLGISLEQIEELKKSKVRTIKIKEGIPFIPGFLLGYILMIIFGNWIVLFF